MLWLLLLRKRVHGIPSYNHRPLPQTQKAHKFCRYEFRIGCGLAPAKGNQNDFSLAKSPLWSLWSSLTSGAVAFVFSSLSSNALKTVNSMWCEKNLETDLFHYDDDRSNWKKNMFFCSVDCVRRRRMERKKKRNWNWHRLSSSYVHRQQQQQQQQ